MRAKPKCTPPDESTAIYDVINRTLWFRFDYHPIRTSDVTNPTLSDPGTIMAACSRRNAVSVYIALFTTVFLYLQMNATNTE